MLKRKNDGRGLRAKEKGEKLFRRGRLLYVPPLKPRQILPSALLLAETRTGGKEFKKGT